MLLKVKCEYCWNETQKEYESFTGECILDF